MNNTFIFLFAISSILSFHESARAQQHYKQRDFFALISTSLLMYDADIHVDRSNEELEDDSLREITPADMVSNRYSEHMPQIFFQLESVLDIINTLK